MVLQPIRPELKPGLIPAPCAARITLAWTVLNSRTTMAHLCLSGYTSMHASWSCECSVLLRDCNAIDRKAHATFLISWGIPKGTDAGSIAVRVVERKSYPTPGSPSKRRNSTDSKWSRHDSMGGALNGSADSAQVVGRFVLDVTDRRSVG